MDKQPKLIDANKLLDWVDKKKIFVDHWLLSKEIGLGTFDLDSTPVPTIEPGDKLKHSDLGIVRAMSEPMITVLKDKEEYEVYLSDLEVVE